MVLFAPTSFMLVPTMACQASCTYCFAKKSASVVTPEVADASVNFIARVAPRDERILVTFHGGEPLLAGFDFYAHVLPTLRERFGRRARLAMQSNLCTMTDELAELLARYEVRVGTSVDGPEDMHDVQRGEGSYAKTSDGMALLRSHGVAVSTICTFSAASAQRAPEVFARAKGPYAIHGAVPTLGAAPNEACVSAEQMACILRQSYEAYRADPAHARVTSIDAMAEGVMRGRGVSCVFSACVGSFAAIGPDGSVYPCQRFCGMGEFCLGNVCDGGGLTAAGVEASTTWERLVAAQAAKERACGGCAHVAYCHGGCLYNAFAAGMVRDSYCAAYKETFDRISSDMALEMGEVLLGTGAPTPTLAMAGEQPHPFELRIKRDRALRVWELGRSDVPFAATHLRSRYPENDLNKLYLHITFSCPLRCDHCYADGGVRQVAEMPARRLARIVREACDARFRSVVVTGGEPLAYAGFDELCALLGGIDRKGCSLVLRTSLGFSVERERLEAVAKTFDEVVVSVDGDRQTHDARRGSGRYDLTVANLEVLVRMGYAHKLSFAATFSQGEADGAPARAVQELAARLGVPKVRVRPMLPLGRAAGTIAVWQPCSCGSDDADVPGVRHMCGLGQNLYVEPDGKAYPCYAWCAPSALLGDLSEEGIDELLARGELYAYCAHDVDANERCHTCEVRYLCGGMCRAWVADREKVDSGAFDCASRKARLVARLARLL